MNLNRYRDNEDSTWRHCQRVVPQGVGVGIQNWIAAHVLVGEGNATIISLSTCSFQFFFPFCSIVILEDPGIGMREIIIRRKATFNNTQCV